MRMPPAETIAAVVIESLIRDLLNPRIPVSMHVEAIHSAARLLPLPSEQYDETIR